MRSGGGAIWMQRSTTVKRSFQKLPATMGVIRTHSSSPDSHAAQSPATSSACTTTKLPLCGPASAAIATMTEQMKAGPTRVATGRRQRNACHGSGTVPNSSATRFPRDIPSMRRGSSSRPPAHEAILPLLKFHLRITRTVGFIEIFRNETTCEAGFNRLQKVPLVR